MEYATQLDVIIGPTAHPVAMRGCEILRIHTCRYASRNDITQDDGRLQDDRREEAI